MTSNITQFLFFNVRLEQFVYSVQRPSIVKQEVLCPRIKPCTGGRVSNNYTITVVHCVAVATQDAAHRLLNNAFLSGVLGYIWVQILPKAPNLAKRSPMSYCLDI